jgi:hypothetical protein
MCCNEATDCGRKSLGQEFYCKKKTLITEGGFSSIFRRKQEEECELHCGSLKPENNLLEIFDLI